MPLKRFRPYTPSRRTMTVADFSELTEKKPEKKLLRPKKRISGRNNHGRITMRTSWRWREAHDTVSLTSDAKKTVFPAKLLPLNTIQTARRILRLIVYADGEKRYIIAPN
jgi:large subunit ribosomal protein L2